MPPWEGAAAPTVCVRQQEIVTVPLPFFPLPRILMPIA